MPAVSKQQQRLFGLALSVKRGDTPRSEVSDDVLKIVDTMSEKEIEKYAGTGHTGLPTKKEEVEELIRQEVRNYVRPVIGEGRAFINAARKAKEEGKTEFEFNGKTYPVTIKEGVLNEMTDLEYVGDQLVNGVGEGFMSRNEFVKLVGKETKYDKNTLGKIYDAYLKLDGRNRVKLDMTRNMDKFLKKMGLKEGLEEAQKVPPQFISFLKIDYKNVKDTPRERKKLSKKLRKMPKDVLKQLAGEDIGVLSSTSKELLGMSVSESVVNEAAKPSQVRSAISREKKKLMKKWAQKGGYENFGQKEVSALERKFKPDAFGSSEEREIARMIQDFDNWAMNYTGDMRESTVNEASGEFVVYIERDNGRKKLLHTKKSQRAANMFMTKNMDKILNQSGIRSIGSMSKDQWEKTEARFAENIKKSDMKTITKKEWDRKHKDFKGIVKGQPYMMYYDKDTQSTVYGPVNIKESINERKPSKIVFDNRKLSAAKRINARNWYMKTFPTDELGAEIDKRISLLDVYEKLSKGVDAYKIIGVNDSVVRERIFEKLSKVLGLDYDVIYNMWESVVNEAKFKKGDMVRIVDNPKHVTDAKKYAGKSGYVTDTIGKNVLLVKFPVGKRAMLVHVKDLVMNPNESVNERRKRPSYLDPITLTMYNSKALKLKDLTKDFDKEGIKYDYNTKPFPHIIVYADRNKKVAIVNNRHEFELDKYGIKYDTVIGTIMESVVNEDTKKRFEVDFYKGNSDRQTSHEEIIRGDKFSDIVSQATKIAKSKGMSHVEFYYKDAFIGSIDKRNNYSFKKGRGFSKSPLSVNEVTRLTMSKPQMKQLHKAYGKLTYDQMKRMMLSVVKRDKFLKSLKKIDKSSLQQLVDMQPNSPFSKTVQSYIDGKIKEGVVNERKYSNQTGTKTALLRDNEFSNLLSPKEQKWVRGNDVRIYKGIGMNFSFTDGKSEMTVNVGKPMSIVKKLGRASNEIKKVYQQNESVVNEGKFKKDDLVYNKRTKTVGIVRIGDDKYGEVKTDADGNVSVDELEKYNPIKFKHQSKAKAAPSTEKEVNSRGLFNPFKNESVVSEKKVPKKGSPDYHQHKIAVDTVKNPRKSFMGGPSAKEAEETLMDKFGYTKKEIQKLKK